MADSTLRELEHRFHQTGATEHEVAWLTARLRAGALAPVRVEAAALCGAPAAVEVWSQTRERALVSGRTLELLVGVGPNSLTRWRQNENLPFERQGRRVLFDAFDVLHWLEARTVGRKATSPFYLFGNLLADAEPEAALRAVGACSRVLGAVAGVPRRMAAALGVAVEQLALAPSQRDPSDLQGLGHTPWDAATDAQRQLGFAIYIALDGLERGAPHSQGAASALSALHTALSESEGSDRLTAQETLYSVLRAELVPWLLR